MLDFVAIDVETANADLASICQVGIAQFRNGELADEWKSYVDPEDFFDDINVSIHGIEQSTVRGSPTFVEIADPLWTRLKGNTIVCHTHFDRTALHQAARKYGLDEPDTIWLDSARIARRAWESCARKGYGLADVCSMLGYKFRQHDALEDAKAAGHVVISACRETGLDITGWLKRVRQSIDLHAQEPIRRDGIPEGPLQGEVLVFTGAIDIPRRNAADLAAAVGCQVASGVTKKTTILIVGDQDIRKLAGHTKSSKHRKAEMLIRKGSPIRILRETDFRQLVRLSEDGSSSNQRKRL